VVAATGSVSSCVLVFIEFANVAVYGQRGDSWAPAFFPAPRR
jgi:hypothetical protein